MNAEELRKLADRQKERDGIAFVITKIPEIEREMKICAEQSKYELSISGNSGLNKDRWLSLPHLYNPVITELEKFNFKVSHCDDVKDGTYMVIKW